MDPSSGGESLENAKSWTTPCQSKRNLRIRFAGVQSRVHELAKIGISFVAGIMVGASLLLFGCGGSGHGQGNVASKRVVELPNMRWDHRPEAEEWTRVSLRALRGHASELAEVVPEDIGAYCPGYATASEADRRAFWAGLLSALAKHESTWNPEAVGGDGRWFGLVQISPGTAQGYGCEAQSGEDLKDGALNLSCALRIAAVTVPRDGVVSKGGKGFAADWGPFHSDQKRQDIAKWTSSQPYCSK